MSLLPRNTAHTQPEAPAVTSPSHAFAPAREPSPTQVRNAARTPLGWENAPPNAPPLLAQAFCSPPGAPSCLAVFQKASEQPGTRVRPWNSILEGAPRLDSPRICLPSGGSGSHFGLSGSSIVPICPRLPASSLRAAL